MINDSFTALLREHGLSGMPKVLLAAAECAPLSKTGGLADVAGALPKALREIGIDARVITPYHRCIKEKYAAGVEHLFDFRIWLGWRNAYVGIERLVHDGTTIYLVDNEDYFGGEIYLGGNREGEQYSFFTRAVLEALPNLDFTPDVIHCNDWHTAMLPMLGHTQYRGRLQDRVKYLLTIHNIAFQGRFAFSFVQDMFGVDPCYYTPEFIELNGCADYLKAGCVFADRINTVSPSYAAEIKTPYYADGLEGILNARCTVLTGILNGIDRDVFNPETDPALKQNYSAADYSGKAACKRWLQKSMGLELRDDVPLFSMVTRMTEQKGFDLMACILDDMMCREDMQLMLLGTGDERFEKFMAAAEKRYPGKLCAYIGYKEELSHQVYAAGDFFLMPSRFEPCGLSQMIAMRYGCIPVVRETGGLKDTVIPYNRFPEEGDGFSFTNFDAWEMRDAMRLAMACYKDKEIMDGLIGRAMRKNFGFAKSAEEYARHYIWML